MSKIAKLVIVSLVTRVIIDKNATPEEVVAKAKQGFQAKLDNNELMDNLEEIREDVEIPFGTILQDAEECPVCNSTVVEPDNDFPDTMNNCVNCGSEWVKDGVEITLDARDELSMEEIKKRGWNNK